MAQKFLTNVELEAGLVDGSNSTGTSGYLLSSTGTATSWVDPAAVSVGESEQVHIACKNTSGVTISKGDPVYITGTVGTSYIVQIAAADASNSAKMPAVGLAETDLAINAEGYVIVSGVLKNLTTDPLSTGDGTPSSNNTVYVKAGGGLTKTKPTGSGNLIQNVGKVGRVNSANAGSLAVSTIMRTNDVPNLTTGKIWVGSSTYTTESTIVHLDESNGRMGIGTPSPLYKLDVNGDVNVPFGASTGYRINGNRTLSQVSGAFELGVLDYKTTYPNISFNNDNTFRVQQNGSTRIIVNSSGNVGIGTTSPGFTNGSGLEIEKSGTSTLRLQSAGSHASEINQTTTSLDIVDLSSGTMIFKTSNGEKMRINSSGNVGIGTTSPATKLDVSGVITATGGTSTEWNTAYDNSIVSAAVTGTTTKTLTLTQQDAGTVTASWTDDTGSNNYVTSASFNTADGVLTLNRSGLSAVTVDLDNRYAYLDHIRSLGTTAFTAGGGSNSTITTAQLISEMESDGAFDSYTSVFKTSWSYAGNDDLSDAGRFVETAGTSWITWTDNSDDTARGNITALAIAPNTGGSAGKVFIYNDQGSIYSPGWREVWTSTSDGSGSGLDADLLDGQQGSYYAAASSLSSYLPLAGGTMTGNIAMSNYNITGVNQLEINDPGEGIIWKAGSSGDITLAVVDDTSDNILRLSGTNAELQVGTNRVLTTADEGSGNGLDADTLDGNHASAFALASHTHSASDITSGTLSDARLSSNVFLDRGSIDVTTVTDGSNSNPFDDAHSETKIAENGMRTISYTGASAFLHTWNNGGSASVVQLGAHYNGDDFYMRVRTDGSNWKNWRKLWHNGNDGSGSGLDADTLDGQHASAFLTSYTETDTLDSVTDRGSTTTNSISTGNITANGSILGGGNLFLRSYNNDPKGIFFRDGFEYGDTNQYNLSITVYDDGDGAADGININAYDGIYFNVQSGATPNTKFRVLNTEVRAYADLYTSGDLTVSGGDITLGGTGRIQGIDTVSAGTDAVNKTYVDTNFASASHNHDSTYVNVTGDTMTGDLTVGNGTADNYSRTYFNDGSYAEMRGYGLQFSRGASYIRPTADNTKTLYLGSNTAQWNTLSIDASLTTFNTNGSENMRITSGGNVGIGTTSPGHKLHVVGGNIFGSSNVLATNNVYAAGPNGFVFGSSTSEGEYIYRSGNDIRIYANGGDRLSVLGSGNVGIGTTSPTYTLDVVGAIGMNTYLYHNDDTDTFIGYSANDTFDVNAGGVKQLSVTSNNVNITDTLSYTYPTATGQFNGEIVAFGSFNGTIGAGDVIVYTTAGLNTGWFLAQGNVTYSKGMLGIAMGSTPSAGILIKGFARHASFASGSLGDPLYLSPSTAGDTTHTIPGSTNNIVRIVGYMLNPTNDEIFFDPDKSWVQVS